MKAKTTDELLEWLKAAEPMDYLIGSAGFIAGMNGLTPMTLIIGTITGRTASNLTTMQDKAASGDEVAKAQLRFMDGSLMGVSPAFGLINVMVGGMTNAPTGDGMSPEDRKTYQEGWMAKISLGCLGFIEAIAITRPGAMAAVANLASSAIGSVGAIIPKL
jgi:hypothetical protein